MLTAGLPGPWGEAIKSVLAAKQLEFVAAAQEAGGDNPALVAWTGQASAPVLAWKDTPPRTTWLAQLELAEALAPDRPLLSPEPAQRAQIIGLCHAVAGQDGLGWNRRTQLTGMIMSSGKAPPYMQRMADRYGYSEAAHAACEGKLVDLLHLFRGVLAAQQERGSDYLVGGALTAADLYLANFLGMLDPLPEALNPMPAQMRGAYSYRTAALADALDPGLLQHRDRIYQRHISTPLDF